MCSGSFAANTFRRTRLSIASEHQTAVNTKPDRTRFVILIQTPDPRFFATRKALFLGAKFELHRPVLQGATGFTAFSFWSFNFWIPLKYFKSSQILKLRTHFGTFLGPTGVHQQALSTFFNSQILLAFFASHQHSKAC